jgi:CheY-like chemotaxis protein
VTVGVSATLLTAAPPVVVFATAVVCSCASPPRPNRALLTEWVDSVTDRLVSALEGIAVLAVDDDRDGLEVLAYVIGQAGGEVRKARNAREALELLLTWTPDVLLLDISMPDMDGYELLRTIRGVRRLREVPALAVTALAFSRDEDRAAEAGFNAHVTKPFEVEDLIKLVERLASKKPAEEA